MEESERTLKGTHEEEEDDEDEIWSWGAGTEGQLGTTNLNDENTPQFLLNLSESIFNYGSISSLSCGGAHVIALTLDGKVLTWGRGSSGQLGHGEIVPNCLNPNPVKSLSTYTISHVSAGWNHSGFVSDSGSLFTCGDGSFGQLGHGDYESHSFPREVEFFRSKHVEQVACGMRHTLVQTHGDSGDQVHGFGSNSRGQLGVSKSKIRSLSDPHLCLGFESAQVVTVLANGDHSAALSGDGDLYTWGRAFSGRSNIYVPEVLVSSLSVKEVALGWNHALLLTGDGEVSMLGGSRHGTLSEPEKTTDNGHNLSGNGHLQEVTGFDGRKIVKIAAGAEHSAVITEDGEIWTWGWGEHGQLGLGNTNDQASPQLVHLPNLDRSRSLTSRVYCGSGFTFAVRSRRQVDGSIE